MSWWRTGKAKGFPGSNFGSDFQVARRHLPAPRGGGGGSEARAELRPRPERRTPRAPAPGASTASSGARAGSPAGSRPRQLAAARGNLSRPLMTRCGEKPASAPPRSPTRSLAGAAQPRAAPRGGRGRSARPAPPSPPRTHGAAAAGPGLAPASLTLAQLRSPPSRPSIPMGTGPCSRLAWAGPPRPGFPPGPGRSPSCREGLWWVALGP